MPSSKNGCLTRILLWLNFGLILTTAACYIAPNFPPSSFWPAIFLGMAFPVLVIFHFIFIMSWAIFKKWYFVLSLVCVIVCWENIGLLVGHPFKVTDMRKIPTTKIVSLNAAQGKFDSDEAISNFIEKEKPDILCLQEFYIKSTKWKGAVPLYEHQKTRKTQTILSKHPIQNSGIVDIVGSNGSNGCSWADIKIQDQIIRFYNLHLSSNRISGKVDNLAENTEVNNLNDKETWRETRSILSLVKESAKIRGKQAKTIKQHIASSPHPVIVCGDFNDPPQSYTYNVLSQNLKDHFKEQGTGRGFTYNGNIPFLKIDYILSSPSIPVYSHEVIREDFSDHFPVISVIGLE